LERLGNFIGIESKRTVKKLLEGKPGRVWKKEDLD
jgi:hypothetical protein